MSTGSEMPAQPGQTGEVERVGQYHKPTLSDYGELHLLTRANPGRGPDGPGADFDGPTGDDSAS